MRAAILVILLFCAPAVFAQAGTETVSLDTLLIRAAHLPGPPGSADSLTRRVTSTYYSLVTLVRKYAVLRQAEVLMGDLDHVAETRYREGDIDLLEMTVMKDRVARISTEVSMLGDQITITGNNLKHLLQTDTDLIPSDTAPALYMIRKTGSPLSPVDPVLQENMELELTRVFRKLRYFEQDGLELARRILTTGRLRYEKEDIGYSEFTEAVEKSAAIQINYLDAVDAYNQIAIQLETYAY